MKITLVAATLPEIQPLLSAFSFEDTSNEKPIGQHLVRVLITGAGMVPTAYSLGRHFSIYNCELAINAGIAGSFDFSIGRGEVCSVKQDTFAELGAEDGDGFLSIDHLGLGIATFTACPAAEFSTLGLREVNAITVNKVHGNELTIAQAIARFSPQIESMEGASFFYACSQANVPCIQLRSISNYVERRNREHWDIATAVKNLNETLINLLQQ